MNQLLSWVEIPALNLDRAINFYQNILNLTIEKKEVGGHMRGIIKSGDSTEVTILSVPDFIKPSDQGVNIYFHINQPIDEVLEKVETLGGKIIIPKTDAGELGSFAWILDSEGNRVSIHFK